METWRLYVVLAEDNSNIRIHDFEAPDRESAEAQAASELAEGEAIDQVVHITPDTGPATPSAEDLQAQIARLEAQLAEMQEAQQ